MITMNEFLAQEKTSKDTIDVKRIYIDMAGDLVAGILLSQILYWHLPGKNDSSRLRVKKEGSYWLAKTQNDWFDECRITAKQYRRAINILKKLGFIETKVFKFAGDPTTHLKINWETFLKTYSCLLKQIGYCPKVNNEMS
jgi:hypothetical protein